MTNTTPTGCCSLIDPAQYDGKTITLTGRHFIRGRIRSLLHIPLNFGSVCTRLVHQATVASALPEPVDQLWLTDENSLWGADMYLAVTKPISGADNASIEGEWTMKVFEGPYSKVASWYKEVQPAERVLVFYTACPKCAKHYGKNYVVLFYR